MPGKNDLCTTAPQVAKSWHPTLNGDLTAAQVSKGMHRKVFWLCGLGHTWEAQVYTRSRSGCPYCANKEVLKGYNDLATTHPELLREWDFAQNSLTPDSVVAGTGERLHWKCEFGHRWEARGAERKNGQTCPVCLGTSAWPGFNDLFTKFPALRDEWDFSEGANTRDPQTLLPGSDYVANWVCNAGHEFSQRVANRTVKGYGCPTCSGLEIRAGVNDLFTVAPWVKDLWDWEKNTVDPTTIGKGHRHNHHWICREKGHPYVSLVQNVINGVGCGVCGGYQILAGVNDLATTHPEIAAEWDYEKNSLTPSEVGKSFGGKKVHWVCSGGHRWFAAIASRTNPALKAGCPSCAVSGYDQTQEGLIYYLSMRTGPARKVGITNPANKTSRIGQLSKDGWEVLRTWTGPGDHILATETAFFAALRFKDEVPTYFGKADRMSGYSETFSADSVNEEAVISAIEYFLSVPIETLQNNYGRRTAFSIVCGELKPE